MKNEFLPTSEATRNALEAHSGRIRRSIVHLLEVIQSSAGVAHPEIGTVIEVARRSTQFRPETHFYHNKLISAMRCQHPDAAEMTYQKLAHSLIGTKDSSAIRIASIGTTDWEDAVLGSAVEIASVETGQTACAKPLSPDEFAEQSANLRAGLDVIRLHHLSMYFELTTLVQSIKLFSGKITQGLTDTRAFGEIYVRIPRQCVAPVPYYVEHVVHEASHTYLNCLMADDAIVLNEAGEKYISPLRKDLRPMYAVYHATFVAARMALTFKTIFESTDDPHWAKLLAEVSDETARGIETISKSGVLTLRGQAIFSEINKLLNEISTMQIWQYFDFKQVRPHRGGAGVAQHSTFQAFLNP
ncbi:aKG-HExxH-type peptide beta-hydroxylase [Trinickia sp.]|uniref:aKG-HExxH-type peptide beta-hydroxylase n=1 Tax=Trinickia sp. TaxID=2571163 RepID=UPI003F7CEAD3